MELLMADAQRKCVAFMVPEGWVRTFGMATALSSERVQPA